MRKILTMWLILMVVGLFGLQSTSQAALTLFLDDGQGNTVTVIDGGGGDANATAGAVTFVGSLGSWTVNVTTGISKPVVGSVTVPHIDLSSVNVSSSGAGDLDIKVVDDNFSPNILPQVFIFNVGGTTSGDVDNFTAFVDETNKTDFSNITSSVALGPFGPGAFSGTVSGLAAANTPFSLGIMAEVSHDGAGVTSFNAEVKPVPLPGAILLLGAGMARLVAYARRRKED